MIRLRWEYFDKPYRVGRIEMDIRWPRLSETRLKAAQRAAEQCTIHHTLQHSTELVTILSLGPSPE